MCIQKYYIRIVLLFIFGLISLTSLSAIILSQVPGSNEAHATDTSVLASVTVSSACTMSGNIASGSEHTETVQNSSYTTDIGETVIEVSCNDAEGYTIYAVGYTNNTEGNTNLIGANTSLTIPTGTVTDTSVSNWAMKLTAAGTNAPTILSDTNGAYSNYHVVPSTATKVATLTTNTASTSQIKTTYAVAISSSQPADTYTGQVKYTVVHPNYANADDSVDTIEDITYMQEITPELVAHTPVGTTTTLIDNRDTKSYTVAKLADDNVWMTQNLDHDIVTTQGFYTYANTDIGHGSTPNTNATWTADTATYATNDTTWSDTKTEPESYDPGDLCWNGTIRNDYNGTIATDTVACGNDKHYHIGNYYNWTAAVAMNDSSSYTTNLTDVDQSICPAGWRLPTYSGNKPYDILVTELSLTSGTSGNVQNTPVYFVYGGYWDGASYFVGGDGDYWSSVVNGGYSAYAFFFDRYGGVDLQSYDGRDGGYSVRCVAR